MSSFLGLAEPIAAKGLFSSLYTDGGGHYFFTPETGGQVSKEVVTQVGQALAHLGIEHIAAYSPEARGRSERAFRTIQDRLPKDLALAGIVDDIVAANRFPREEFVLIKHRLFAVKPELEDSAFVPAGDLAWRDALCVHEQRVVAPDNMVSWNGRGLQIPSHPSRPRVCPRFGLLQIRCFMAAAPVPGITARQSSTSTCRRPIPNPAEPKATETSCKPPGLRPPRSYEAAQVDSMSQEGYRTPGPTTPGWRYRRRSKSSHRR